MTSRFAIAVFNGVLRPPHLTDVGNGSAVIYAVRTSGEKFLSSLHCVAKKEKSKRVPKPGLSIGHFVENSRRKN